MVRPDDDHCRVLGEDVWEFDDAERADITLDPSEFRVAPPRPTPPIR